MNKISEIKPGLGWEVQAELVSIRPVRRLWKCYNCGAKGLWKDESEAQQQCPMCGAKESDEKSHGLWIQKVTTAVIKDDSGTCNLDLWKEEVDLFQVGSVVHVLNGFAKLNGVGTIDLSRGKFGNLQKVK